VQDEDPPTVSSENGGEFSSNPELFEGTTTGSGSGQPLLVQRSVATQVRLHNLVGKGRYGEVWRGSFKGDDVAVKIFHTKEESSWVHEVDIYQTCLIRHPNILRFIAADNKDNGLSIQLWLITEYCEYGSLYEVLLNQTVDESQMLKLCYTAACGLAHLHSEITGTEGKPAIAHRDLKSRNILVKKDYSCTIADLGLALRYNRATDSVEELPTKRVGTRRYLSPEILDDSMNTKNFDCFKRSDVYSFGLVLWEISRRGLCQGQAEEYQLPYFDLVTPDPSFEEVKRVVAVEKKRPSFPNRWIQSKVFDDLSKIIEQCWYHNGEARLTALRIKKNLHNIQPVDIKLKDNTSISINTIQS
jgi:TGF-beta receptor type-1